MSEMDYVYQQMTSFADEISKAASEISDQTSLTNKFNKDFGQLTNGLLPDFNREFVKFNDEITRSVKSFKDLRDPTNKLAEGFKDLKKKIDDITGKASAAASGPPPPTPPSPPPPTGGSGGNKPPNTPATPPNPPPANPDPGKKVVSAFDGIFRSFRRVVNSNTTAMRGLGTRLISSYNITNKLTENIEALEQQQLQGYAMGIDNIRFMQENSQALENSTVGQRELAATLLSNFDAGIRKNTTGVNSLNEVLIATGQGTEGLQAMNARLLSVTGKNYGVIDRLSRTNENLSDTYQVSNSKLIEAVEALTNEMETAAMFSDQAAEGMGTLATDIKAKTGGVVSDKDLASLAELLTPSLDNLASINLLGARDLSQKVAEGSLTSFEQLTPLLDKIQSTNEKLLGQGGSPEDLAAARRVAVSQYGLNESQYQALLRIAKLQDAGVEINKEATMAAEQEKESLKNAREKANDFFFNAGTNIYKPLAAIAPALNSMSIAINAMGAAGGALESLSNLPGMKGGKGIKKLGLKLGGRKGLKAAGGLIKGVGRVAKASPLAIAGSFLGDVLDMGERSLGFEEGSTVDKSTNVLGKAAAWAGTGAMLGSFFPGFGNVIGGALGGLAGAIAGAMDEFGEETKKNPKKTAEEIEKQRCKSEAEKKAAAAKQTRELQFMSNYVRRAHELALVSDPASQEKLDGMNKQLLNLNTKIESIPKDPIGGN